MHWAAALNLLSFNIIIAERGAKFGFPENIFGLFPGMGTYSFGGKADMPFCTANVRL
jgi:enoyl-CoA hydratase/carnithine racemase